MKLLPKIFGVFQGSDNLRELERQYLEAVEENAVAWQEAARLGRVIALYDARVKTRVDADTRVREAERTARVLTSRQTAVDVFWTSLLNGEYDDGLIPVPTEPADEFDSDLPDLEDEDGQDPVR